MHNFKKLEVWQKGIDLVVSVYETTRQFPDTEKFHLVTQMQRAATSIPLNIAEGCGRGTNPVLKQFLGHALGSAFELETQIIVCKKLGYINQPSEEKLINEVSSIQRMLHRFIDNVS